MNKIYKFNAWNTLRMQVSLLMPQLLAIALITMILMAVLISITNRSGLLLPHQSHPVEASIMSHVS